MSNDTALAILLTCLLAMSFFIGALMGYMRRDSEWRNYIADQRSALDELDELDDHWKTTIRE